MKIDDLKETGTALTKRELVAQIASETGLTQLEVFDVVQKTLDGIVDALGAGKHVEFREFGVFEVTTRKARIGRNPNRPEDVVMIPVRRVVKFKPGKRMRDMLANQ
ncbi:MAG: HU family DNA-binding protein [Kiritimatiellia bacterium]|jgi:nucleoid DNA-binding protein|nr:integration host factor subunit beta [Kiritimatiellia bacterium]MDD4172612.1 integration host factor subunit beta [Kiritimatiellia bacterium]MDD4442162.1 integration host factor subunit beta [Kiritimatiellia bacterium]MDX9792154.1 HU family DNA-binding protein [Kiritimatiellia bacterium]